VHESGAVSGLVFSIMLGIGAFAVAEYVATGTAERVKAVLTARGIAG
jgi:hypothetical protein